MAPTGSFARRMNVRYKRIAELSYENVIPRRQDTPNIAKPSSITREHGRTKKEQRKGKKKIDAPLCWLCSLDLRPKAKSGRQSLRMWKNGVRYPYHSFPTSLTLVNLSFRLVWRLDCRRGPKSTRYRTNGRDGCPVPLSWREQLDSSHCYSTGAKLPLVANP